MTWTSDLALSALWFGAGAAAAWRFTMLHYQSRLSAAKQSANLFAAWWERDSAKMLIAQAQLDLIHQQHVDAGKKAHEPWKALQNLGLPRQSRQPAQRFKTGAGHSCRASAAPVRGRNGTGTPIEWTGHGRGHPPRRNAVGKHRE